MARMYKNGVALTADNNVGLLAGYTLGGGTTINWQNCVKPSDEVRKGPYVSPRGPYDHIIADSGKAETMMWVMDRPDGGRSFGFTGGHTHTHWGDPNQRRLMLNALLWIAKVNVPPGGVQDTITAADLAANLDDKSRRQ